ncbi:ANTAR domain-containing protein [Paracoccus sp. DMF-8]
MKARNVDEDQAYAMMRRTAMDQKQRIADIARAVIAAADLLR